MKMKYRVDLPIVNLSSVILEVEADNEEEAIAAAESVWSDYAEEIMDGGIINGMPVPDGTATVVKYIDFVDNEIGDDIDVDLVDVPVPAAG
jgi:hypothetical protein